MDEFDDFFADKSTGGNEYTPIYHTPDNNNSQPPHKKNNGALIAAIVVAALMCIVVLVNVIVLASLKNSIAEEYSAKMQDALKDAYSDAIKDVIDNEDIIEDIISSAQDGALDSLANNIGTLTRKYASSVAMIKATNNDGTVYAGSGFLIGDDASGNRYIATNAHVAAKETATVLGGYKFTPFKTITCTFGSETEIYHLEVVTYGEFRPDNTTYSPKEPDLAILRITGAQPDSTHKNLKIADNDGDIEIGDEVAVIGNPKGYGLSMSTGIISHEVMDMKLEGNMFMTTAAVNPGNSGGPMLNKNGVVLGVVESKIVDEDIDLMSFAVSARTLVDFIEDTNKLLQQAGKSVISYQTATLYSEAQAA